MRRLLIGTLLLAFSLTSVTACERRRKRDKRYKKWKKRHKREKRWKKRHKRDKRHKRKAERVKLKVFFGDNTSVYLDRVPVKIGQPKSEVKDWFGKKKKRKFKCDDGKYSVKAKYDGDDKVKEIKVIFKIDKETIIGFAKKKWGEPKKVNAKRTKWVKDGLKIIIKRKHDRTKLSIKKNKPKKGKDGMAAKPADGMAKDGMAKDGMAKDGMAKPKDGMAKGMLPDADDDDDDDDDDD